jgi:hypothetical protein
LITSTWKKNHRNVKKKYPRVAWRVTPLKVLEQGWFYNDYLRSIEDNIT